MNLDFELKRRDDEERRIFTEIIIPRDSRARFRDRPARKIFKLRGSELPPLPQSVSVRYPSSRSIASRFILAVHFLKKRKHGSRRNWPLTFQSRVNNTTKHPPLCVISIGLSSLPRQGLTLTKPSSTINLLSLSLFFRGKGGARDRRNRQSLQQPPWNGWSRYHAYTHTHTRADTMDGWIWHTIRRWRDAGSCRECGPRWSSARRRRGQVEETRNGTANRGRFVPGEGYIGCIGLEYSIFSALGQPEDGARPTGRFDKGGLLADVTTPSDVSPRYDTPLAPHPRFFPSSALHLRERFVTTRDTTHPRERSRRASRTRRSN